MARYDPYTGGIGYYDPNLEPEEETNAVNPSLPPKEKEEKEVLILNDGNSKALSRNLNAQPEKGRFTNGINAIDSRVRDFVGKVKRGEVEPMIGQIGGTIVGGMVAGPIGAKIGGIIGEKVGEAIDTDREEYERVIAEVDKEIPTEFDVSTPTTPVDNTRYEATPQVSTEPAPVVTPPRSQQSLQQQMITENIPTETFSAPTPAARPAANVPRPSSRPEYSYEDPGMSVPTPVGHPQSMMDQLRGTTAAPPVPTPAPVTEDPNAPVPQSRPTEQQYPNLDYNGFPAAPNPRDPTAPIPEDRPSLFDTLSEREKMQRQETPDLNYGQFSPPQAPGMPAPGVPTPTSKPSYQQMPELNYNRFNSKPRGQLNWNGYGTLVNDYTKETLQKAQDMLGFDITIRDGGRQRRGRSIVDERGRVIANSAKNSQHLNGAAVDIDLRGLDDTQREQLATALMSAAEEGRGYIGAYSGNTGLHYDTRKTGFTKETDDPRNFGGIQATYDRSYKGMASIPKTGAWFEKAVENYKKGDFSILDTGLNFGLPDRIDDNVTVPTGRPDYTAPQRDLSSATKAPRDLSSIVDTPGGFMASGLMGGLRTPEERDKMAFAIAGELAPEVAARLGKNDPKARSELSSIVATMENRAHSTKYSTMDDVLTPSQYNSLSKGALKNTKTNFSAYGKDIRQAIDDYYDGVNFPETPKADMYANYDVVTPSWDKSVVDKQKVGSHTFSVGNYKGTNQQYYTPDQDYKTAARAVLDKYTTDNINKSFADSFAATASQEIGSKLSSDLVAKKDKTPMESAFGNIGQTNTSNKADDANYGSGKDRSFAAAGLDEEGTPEKNTDSTSNTSNTNSGGNNDGPSFGKDKDSTDKNESGGLY